MKYCWYQNLVYHFCRNSGFIFTQVSNRGTVHTGPKYLHKSNRTRAWHWVTTGLPTHLPLCQRNSPLSLYFPPCLINTLVITSYPRAALLQDYTHGTVNVYFNVILTYKSDISISRAVLVYCYRHNTRVRLSVVPHDLLLSSHIDTCIWFTFPPFL